MSRKLRKNVMLMKLTFGKKGCQGNEITEVFSDCSLDKTDKGSDIL